MAKPGRRAGAKLGHRRVAVTGLGVVSPVGNTVPLLWDALVAGRSGIAPIEKFDSSRITVPIAAEVKDFDPADHADGRTIRTNDPGAIYQLAAAREAFADAGLAEAPRPSAFGVIIGLDVPYQSVSRAAVGFDRSGQLGVDATSIVQSLPATAGALVAHTFGLRGAQNAVSGACASGAVAILQAWNLIQLGYVDAAVAGCASTLDASLIASCAAARVLSENPDPVTASRPFDLERDGFVIGEGAAALVLEAERHAAARSAPVYAELLGGWQGTSVAGFTVNPAEDCAACMTAALEASGVDASEVDVVSAHATSTRIGDRQEAAALGAVFGECSVPSFAAKSVLGHCMTASAGLETLALLLAMRDGIAPPTMNQSRPDPECKVDCVPNEARRLPIRVGLKNSFGFGGVNCCLVFRTWD
jgi:3-oxoacyl-(acyl-carrier-protein) synthase